MSGKAMDNVWEEVYKPFLNGPNGERQRKNNPAQNRVAVIERMYVRILTELCINRFNWQGLEKTGISPRFLELNLARWGLAVVFKEKRTDRVIAMQGAPTGQWNWFQDPIGFTVIGPQFGSLMLKAKNCVPVWANFMRQPDLDIVCIYSQRLAELDRTIEINMKSARTPRIIFANENGRLSARNISDAIDKGSEVIEINVDAMSGETFAESFQVADMAIHPDAITNLHILKTRIWGECMGLLGFDYANQDKKERLVAAEVDANNSQVDGMRSVNLNARRIAAEQINNMFGLDISVDYHITSETSLAVPPTPTPPTVGATE